MRISDWSSDVCSSDLAGILLFGHCQRGGNHGTTRVVHRIAEDIVELDGVRDTAVDPGRGGAEGRGAAAGQAGSARTDRKSDVEGKSVSVSVDLGGRRIINTTLQRFTNIYNRSH